MFAALSIRYWWKDSRGFDLLIFLVMLAFSVYILILDLTIARAASQLAQSSATQNEEAKSVTADG